MSPVKNKPPKKEIGGEGASPGGGNPLIPGWIETPADVEYVPELQWPLSIQTYEQMRGDSQISGCMLGCTLPIRRYRWYVDPNGAPDDVARKLADDLGLPLKDDPEEKTSKRVFRFSWDDYLRHVFMALEFGHMYFEQVGEIGEDGLWHLRRLAPRLPRTLLRIEWGADGGLQFIQQKGRVVEEGKIPVTQLIGFAWNKEGSNWYGRSMLRPLYKNWLIKDKLIRVDAIKHERNGMGIPVVQAPPGASKKQLSELNRVASRVRVGSDGAATMPDGAMLTFEGVRGNLPDTIESIKYHDQQMSRSLLQMFAELGTTQSGNRALGDTFMEFFHDSQLAVADWFCYIHNMHMNEDWIDWNYGTEMPSPLVKYDPGKAELAVADLVGLVTAGAIQVDDELENFIRIGHELPERDGPRLDVNQLSLLKGHHLNGAGA